jgi:DNA-binding NarL/FixJ family response regulator
MIVEDQTAIRQLIARFLEASQGFIVVAEAATAEEALQLAERHRPQVVVLDWILPGGTGVKFLREGLRGENPPRVLVFSGTTTDLAIREALTHGAKGYLEKTAKFAEFTAAMRAMAEGRVYLSPDIAKAVHRMSCAPQSAGLETDLTPRELEVLRSLAEGLSSKEIATRLGISIRTVGNHRARIAQKTGLGSIAQLTLHAVRLGLVAEATREG